MRLIEVNGKSLLGASHAEAVNILRQCGNTIYMIVCKGYDKAEVDRAVAEGRLIRGGSVSSRSQSVSSLDVPDEDLQQVCFSFLYNTIKLLTLLVLQPMII